MILRISSCSAILTKSRLIATGATLVIALTVVTPLCGYLFRCGCTWPWAGLDAACNIHDPSAPHQCPWCASLLAGWLSVATAVAAGLAAATVFRTKLNSGNLFETIVRILLGIAVFGAVAFLAGGLSAKLQHYTLGIFGVSQ